MRGALALLLLLIATPAWAQGRSFTIGGEAFSESEVLDARAQPQLGGPVAVMITFSESAASRLASLTKRLLNKPLPIVLDGRTLVTPNVAEIATGAVVQISGNFTLTEAEALAKAISGKDPLPESLEE